MSVSKGALIGFGRNHHLVSRVGGRVEFSRVFSRFHARWRTRLLSKSLAATPYDALAFLSFSSTRPRRVSSLPRGIVIRDESQQCPE